MTQTGRLGLLREAGMTEPDPEQPNPEQVERALEKLRERTGEEWELPDE